MSMFHGLSSSVAGLLITTDDDTSTTRRARVTAAADGVRFWLQSRAMYCWYGSWEPSSFLERINLNMTAKEKKLNMPSTRRM